MQIVTPEAHVLKSYLCMFILNRKSARLSSVPVALLAPEDKGAGRREAPARGGCRAQGTGWRV